jgi:cobalamin biosynthesis protein CobW
MVGAMQSSLAPPVPLTIVTGFLGSGKSTLLRRVLADPVIGPRVAILVNELGALGVDGELISSARAGAHVSIVELVSGCLCCTLQGDLIAAIDELARPVGRPPPSHLLVETSGAALASQVRFALSVLSLSGNVRAEGVITLVDAAAAPRAAAEAPAVFADQLRCADLVLLNKIELVDETTGRERIAWISSLAPQAEVLPVTVASVDVGLLLGMVPLHREVPRRPSLVETNGGHGLVSHSISIERVVEHARLRDWLEDLGTPVFRVKGIVDSDEGPLLIQAVADQVEIEPLPPALAQAARRLVFIGAHLDPLALEAGIATI